MTASDQPLIGRRLRRREDPALLRGAGRYLDDIKLPDTLHVAFVRSPHAHALLRSIEVVEAGSMRGVVAIYTAADLAKVLVRLRLPMAFPAGKLNETAMPFVLASNEACYVGEALAMVVASSRYLAEDAAERVAVDYEVLTPLVDPLTETSCEAEAVSA